MMSCRPSVQDVCQAHAQLLEAAPGRLIALDRLPEGLDPLLGQSINATKVGIVPLRFG